MFKFCRQYIRPLSTYKSIKNCEKTIAIEFDPSAKCLQIIEKTTPQTLNAETVLIKIAYAGISGTDLKIIDGTYPLKNCSKIILGHEISGTVARKCHDYEIGDRVAVNPTHSCQTCDKCREKNENYCANVDMNHVGINRDGGWQNFCEIPTKQLYKIPENVTLADAILMHPMSCVCHAWNLLKPVAHACRILIVGAGFIGNLFAAFFHFHGHKNVTICEENIRKLNLTAKLNTCYELVTPEALGKSNAKLFDVIVDCSGDSKAIEVAVDLLNYGGRFCIFGISDANAEIKISPYDVFRKELRIFAPKLNPYAVPNTFEVIRAMNSRYVNYEKLGMEVYKLGDYKQALACLRFGQISKAVFCLIEPVHT